MLDELIPLSQSLIRLRHRDFGSVKNFSLFYFAVPFGY